MVTRKGPLRSVHALAHKNSVHTSDDGGEAEHKMLVTWVREKMNRAATNTSLLEEIIDPMLEGKYEMGKMETLVRVALQCVQEDKDARPTMSQVVEMLLRTQKMILSDGVMSSADSCLAKGYTVKSCISLA
ncbi:isoform 2 of probable receptor-like serine/threonine-protein kinase [Fagus crenata]